MVDLSFFLWIYLGSFVIIISGDAMKVYKNNNDLIQGLEDKGLEIGDRNYANGILTDINYFFLKGYFPIFTYYCETDNKTKFKNGYTIEHLISFYTFDKNIKTIILREILDIEQRIKNAMCEIISSRYGVRDSQYLRRSNFDANNEFLDMNLNKVRRQRKNNGKKHSAYLYYKNKHGYFPFWILSKVLTLGAVLGLFSVMKPSDKDYISRIILPNFREKKIVKKFTNMFTLVVQVRNICAHDDILYNFNTKYADIWKLNEHNNFNLKQYTNKVIGRNDLFATIISLKYFMKEDRFKKFISKLDVELGDLDKAIPELDHDSILEVINFPRNYKDLAKD